MLSRERILVAAHNEFARWGLGGARVDRIASQAGLNKRMIYHYFGGKDDLFSAVLLANYARKRDSEKALQLEQEEPRQAICKLVSLTWNYYLQNPDFLNLLNSANLHQARHLRASMAVRKMHHPFVKMIATILDNGLLLFVQPAYFVVDFSPQLAQPQGARTKTGPHDRSGAGLFTPPMT